MLAKGSEEQTAKAKSIITMAIMGMIVLVAAYAITQFVTTALLTKSTKQVGTETPDLGEGPQGCCVDWVATESQWFGQLSDSAYVGVPACRMTTYADCELQGKTKTQSDAIACDSQSEGCWIFDESIVDPTGQECATAYCK